MFSLPSCSVIVPVLNEAPVITDFLRHLRLIAPAAEIILVDGGSDDRTLQLAEPLADLVVKSRRGRALQMNAGAARARSQVLWFLHADSRLAPNALAELGQALDDPRLAGGCFRLRVASRRWIFRISDDLGNLGVQCFGFALGDHGIFCRRVAFQAVGGYPIVPILEDAELYRRLQKWGTMKQLSPPIQSSPRTYERLGRYRTTFTYALILILYVLRVPIGYLYPFYQRLHRGQEGMKAPIEQGAVTK